MTIVERLAELKQHLEHLRGLQERVASARDLQDDRSLHNDVLTAVRSLSRIEGFSPELVDDLRSGRANSFHGADR